MAKLVGDETGISRDGYYRLLEEEAKGIAEAEVAEGTRRDDGIGRIDRTKAEEMRDADWYELLRLNSFIL